MTLANVTAAPIGALLWQSLRTYQIYGANTDVGKTVFATILCKTSQTRNNDERVAYLKPVSTGPESEADNCHIRDFTSGVSHKVLVQYDLAASPHIAARIAKQPMFSDNRILRGIHQFASDHALSRTSLSWLFIETAGGVHSPAPSGTTQADLYMQLRLPVILVGDAKLGGISQTIAAFESLKIRGYDVEVVLVFHDSVYENHAYLENYFRGRHNIPVVVMTAPPTREAEREADRETMAQYYDEQAHSSTSLGVIELLDQQHRERVDRLKSMASRAERRIWYPFTQQKLLAADKITVIDSAYGSYFQTIAALPDHAEESTASDPALPMLQPSFDGSASWWTQGLGHGNPALGLAAAYAAGRFGHVMFAEAVHTPALELAERLLNSMGNPRLTRVFYSDDGSTGIEIALKMALRASRLRYGYGNDKRLEILGLRGSYHGDTIGAMACAEPSTYNEKVEWYDGRGFWFNYPTVKFVKGKWVIQAPLELTKELGPNQEFDSLAEIMDLKTRATKHHSRCYAQYIANTIRTLVSGGRTFGALLIEPVVLGAGGMIFVDPLFQQTLVSVVRNEGLFACSQNHSHDKNTWSGIPVIFDEVFTGLYRLGRFSAASFLQTDADISVHAKLLTGGVVPLCATLASESIFNAFTSDDKSDALLHGHSYTAHTVGCQIALESLTKMEASETGEGAKSWTWAKNNWSRNIGNSAPEPWSVWHPEFLFELSRKTVVEGAWSLGSVLAIYLRNNDGGGYKSNAARDIQSYLFGGEDRDTAHRWNVHSRVLGNVLYIMADQMTSEEDIQRLEQVLRRAVL